MIGKNRPYSTGEIREVKSGKLVLIAGHIWWPVEKTNAYHCIQVNNLGEPISETPEYIWDQTHGRWPLVA